MIYDSYRDTYSGGDYNTTVNQQPYGSYGGGGGGGSAPGSGQGGSGDSSGSRGSTGMGASAILGYVAHGFSNSISYYGAWYEGEQLNDYYNKQAELTYREKQAFIKKSEYQIGVIRQQAMDAERDVATAETMGDVKEKRYQEQTDGAVASIMARGAASGVDMTYGSPMDFLNKVIEDRAYDYDLMKWENENEAYQRKRVVGALKDKATIMLDEQKMAEDNYDYQAVLYQRAAGDARRAARYKSYQAALNIG